jgi:hypothetical protein
MTIWVLVIAPVPDMIHSFNRSEAVMKTVWLCIWIAFAAAEVALTVWSRSTAFLEIGAVGAVMIAYNLLSVSAGARPSAQLLAGGPFKPEVGLSGR